MAREDMAQRWVVLYRCPTDDARYLELLDGQCVYDIVEMSRSAFDAALELSGPDLDARGAYIRRVDSRTIDASQFERELLARK